MFLFFHLITGGILGLLIGDLLNDRRWLIPCAVGSILPDLFDKPAGFFFAQATSGYGRTFFHTLLVFTLLLVAGLIFWKYRRSVVFLALDIGILSHQVLDAMWNEPVNWLYPFLGPFLAPRRYPPGYIFVLLRENLTNPSEWILGAIFLAGLFLYLKRDHVWLAALRHRKGLQLVLEGSGIFLWMISGLVFTYGLSRKILSHGRFGLSDALIFSLVIALAAFLLWRWGSALGKEVPAGEA